MKKLLVLSAFGLLLAGCATQPDTLSREEKNQAYEAYVNEHKIGTVNRINSFRMHNWQSLTDSYFIVKGSFKKHYLISLKRRCSDLDFSHTLITHQSTSSQLSRNFDAVSVPTYPHLKCYIKEIYPISKEQHKEIAAIGKPAETNSDNE